MQMTPLKTERYISDVIGLPIALTILSSELMKQALSRWLHLCGILLNKMVLNMPWLMVCFQLVILSLQGRLSQPDVYLWWMQESAYIIRFSIPLPLYLH